MPLTPLNEACTSGACSRMYLGDDGKVLVQGDVVAQAAGIELAGGEGLLSIPAATVLEAAARLAASAEG